MTENGVMKLESRDGTRFEMGIAGYQYPEFEEGQQIEDRNWLLADVEAVDAEGRAWRIVDPSLTAGELARLVDWLENFGNLKSDPVSICFMEPCLSFEAARDDGLYLFTVFLESELGRPTGSGSVRERVDSKLHFMLTPAELAEAAASCRRLAESYPVRSMPDQLSEGD